MSSKCVHVDGAHDGAWCISSYASVFSVIVLFDFIPTHLAISPLTHSTNKQEVSIDNDHPEHPAFMHILLHNL